MIECAPLGLALYLVCVTIGHVLCITCVCFYTGRVLIIHAGGFSQRLPNQSVLGKVFLTLPCGKYIQCALCIHAMV